MNNLYLLQGDDEEQEIFANDLFYLLMEHDSFLIPR